MEPRPVFTENNGVLVARTLVDANRGIVPVQLISLGGRGVSLRKDTRVGELVTLDKEVLSVLDGKPKQFGGFERGEGSIHSESPEAFNNRFNCEGSIITGSERDQLESLLWKHRHMFSTGVGDVGRTDVVTHVIPTGDAMPIKQPVRRVPHAFRPLIDQQVQDMIENGIVQPSVSL